MDNLPSVLSGFTPVLTVTPECRIAKRPRICYGEGKERRGTNHLWKGIRPVCGLGESHPQAAELEGTWHISGIYKTVQQRCWEQLWEAHGSGCEGTAGTESQNHRIILVGRDP